jgi:hypothetical protein
MKKRLAVAVLGCLIALVATSASAKEIVTPDVFPPESEPYGKDYEEWAGGWVEWLVEIPLDAHPAVNLTPKTCRTDQEGGVWFVPVAPGTCHVPEGKAILLSPAGWECSTAEGLGETYQELRRCARNNWKRDFGRDVLKVRIHIDGRLVRTIRAYTFLTEGEVIDFPAQNLFDAQPGPSKSVTKGIFFMLRPLSRGVHTLRVQYDDEVQGDATFEETLRVVPS